MAARMNPSLAALCAVAVGAVYTTGFYVTKSSAHQLNPGVPTTSQSPSSASSAKPAANGTRGKSSSSSSQGQSSKSQATPSSGSTQAKYKDGTYHTTGTNAYGSIGIALTIKHGKITSIRITKCTTHYPVSVIDPVLPNRVKAAQTWKIRIVSGATASTYDFAEAVYRALKQAKS